MATEITLENVQKLLDAIQVSDTQTVMQATKVLKQYFVICTLLHLFSSSNTLVCISSYISLNI